RFGLMFGVGCWVFSVGFRFALWSWMLCDFLVYQLAKEFQWLCRGLKLPRYPRDQLFRASYSIVLNIAEGSGKRTPADQRKFYTHALGSLRECQSIYELEKIKHKNLIEMSDKIGGMLFKLARPDKK